MISIVIPVYNVESYLEECIQSALQQTHRDLQVILVDDGSTDGSGRICDQYAAADDRVVVIHKENGGLSDARNVGTAAAEGDFILYLDSDDYLDREAVAILTAAQQESDADIVVGSYYYTYEDHEDLAGNNIDKSAIYSRRDAIQRLMEGKIQTFAWGKLLRSEIVKRHSFPVGMLFEDHFWTHLVFHDSERILCLAEPIVHYRQRKNSISYTFTEKRLDMIKGWQARIDFLKAEYPELLDPFLRRCAQDASSLAWLILTRMRKNAKGFEMLRSFITQHDLTAYCDGINRELLSALIKGRAAYGALALFYKAVGK